MKLHVVCCHNYKLIPGWFQCEKKKKKRWRINKPTIATWYSCLSHCLFGCHLLSSPFSFLQNSRTNDAAVVSHFFLYFIFLLFFVGVDFLKKYCRWQLVGGLSGLAGWACNDDYCLSTALSKSQKQMKWKLKSIFVVVSLCGDDVAFFRKFLNACCIMLPTLRLMLSFVCVLCLGWNAWLSFTIWQSKFVSIKKTDACCIKSFLFCCFA